MNQIKIREPLRTITEQFNSKRPVSAVNHDTKTSNYYLNSSRFNIFNQLTNKRPAEDTCRNVVPAKKINTSTSNSHLTNDKFKIQTTKCTYQHNKYFGNLPMSNPSNNNNINQSMHSNGLALQHNMRVSDYSYPSVSTSKKQAQSNFNFSNNINVYNSFIQPVNKDVHPKSKNTFEGKIKEIFYNNPKINNCSNNVNKNHNITSDSVRSTCSQNANTNSEYSNILLPNVPATTNMKRRMRAALEGILYLAGEKLSKQPNRNKNANIQLCNESFKSIVHERIKVVLMGKPVQSRSDIIDSYLRKYPIDKDEELMALYGVPIEEKPVTSKSDIVDIFLKKYPTEKDNELMAQYRAKNINTSHIPDIMPTEYPKQYFEVNMRRLIDAKMNKIIKVVDDMYTNSGELLKDCIKNKSANLSSSKDRINDADYKMQKILFCDKVLDHTIERDFSKLLEKFKTEIVNMILHKEVCQAVEADLIPKTQRPDVVEH